MLGRMWKELLAMHVVDIFIYLFIIIIFWELS